MKKLPLIIVLLLAVVVGCGEKKEKKPSKEDVIGDVIANVLQNNKMYVQSVHVDSVQLIKHPIPYYLDSEIMEMADTLFPVFAMSYDESLSGVSKEYARYLATIWFMKFLSVKEHYKGSANDSVQLALIDFTAINDSVSSPEKAIFIYGDSIDFASPIATYIPDRETIFKAFCALWIDSDYRTTLLPLLGYTIHPDDFDSISRFLFNDFLQLLHEGLPSNLKEVRRRWYTTPT